jgi:Ser/Thr protein kinase RdoA (MazF antagonist)
MEAANIAQLAEHLGLSGPTSCTQIVDRRGKSVWLLDCSGERIAVRVFRPGEEESARHEREMMLRAAMAGLPVASVRDLVTLERRPVLLVDWLQGRLFADEIRSRPLAAGKLGELFGEQQARMHLVSVAGSESPDWMDFFGAMDPVLQSRLEEAKSPPSLIHLDYHPANLLVDDGAVSAILDWTNSRFGDPRADLAWTWVILTRVFRASWKRPLRRLAVQAFIRGWWRSYVRLRGPQEDMALFRVWALHGLLRIQSKHEPSSRERYDLVALARLLQTVRRKAKLPSITTESLLKEGGSRNRQLL